jgi:hypothetical protein
MPVPLTNAKFDPIHTGRADPSRYLIAGFDTEYQRYANADTSTFYKESVNLVFIQIVVICR